MLRRVTIRKNVVILMSFAGENGNCGCPLTISRCRLEQMMSRDCDQLLQGRLGFQCIQPIHLAGYGT